MGSQGNSRKGQTPFLFERRKAEVVAAAAAMATGLSAVRLLLLLLPRLPKRVDRVPNGYHDRGAIRNGMRLLRPESCWKQQSKIRIVAHGEGQ